ncbi:MAG: hypothetical protein JST62_09360 [Bacteroidetes bacterium]|jgi:hypothetical protein|nr:hypothetical protein [Bacteroidota bacterium]
MFVEILQNIIDLQIAFFLFLIVWKKKNLGKHINVFILAVSTNLLSLMLAKFLISTNYLTNNHIVFNIGVLLLTFLFYFVYFYKKTTQPNLKKMQLAVIILFLLSYLIFIISDELFFKRFSIDLYFVETILLITSIGVFLFQTFKSELVLNIKQYFPFWVSIGLLILYCGLLPILIFSTKPGFSINMNLFNSILILVNVVGYGTMIRGVFSSK